MRVVCLLSVVSCLALAACGPPSPGDSCKNDLELTCFSSFSALECRAGKWTKIPCLGQGGCFRTSGSALCDISFNHVGDLCPRILTGYGYCSAFDKVVACTDGVLQELSCPNCPNC